MDILDNKTKQVIGCFLKYKNDSGPCIFGKTEFVPDASFKQRCLAAVSSRESPIRSNKNPRKVGWPLKPGYSSVQAYEPWVSLGMCHAISRNGNAQRLLQSVLDTIPELRKKLRLSGFDVIDKTIMVIKPKLATASKKEIRSVAFVKAVHFVLEDPRTIPVQVDFFWSLITEREHIVDNCGWKEKSMEDERVFLIIASLAINAGVELFKRILLGAKEKTSDSLTNSRVGAYKRLGLNFGVDRAKWERTCKYAIDGKNVEL